MAHTATQIIEAIEAIEAYVEEHGGLWSQWYVGIAADARDRLFSDHKVRERGDAWIYWPAATSRLAREIEAHLIAEHDVQGGTGGGGENTRYVYAYRIAAHTAE